MITKKLLGPPNLMKTQGFYGYKAVKVIIIGKNKNFVFATF